MFFTPCKKSGLLYVLISFSMVFGQSNKAITLDSKITQVTVYSDRAEVTREGKLNLDKGIQQLVFDNLPDAVDRDSIQVNGKGAAVLKDVKIQARYFADIPDQERKALFDREQSLSDQLIRLGDLKKVSEGEKDFIQRISEKLTSNQEESATPELDPAKWLKMVAFYGDKQRELTQQIRDFEKNIRTVQNDLEKVRQEIKEIGYRKNKKRNLVEALVEMKNAGSISLTLRYIVMGPQWIPNYDLRVSTEEKNLNLTYYGLITQNSGEDWNGAAISLSTARLNIGGMQPELEPWTLDFYQPRPKRAMYEKSKESMMQNFMTSAAEPEADAMPRVEESIQVVQSEAEMGGTAVVFHIPGSNTIQSDNQQHKVTISILDFPIHLRYSTVPKLAEYAYLKAKAENKSDFSLLAGETQVFLDGRFVSNSSLEFVAPGSTFWSFLGVDESVHVERKLIRKYESNPGIFSKQTKIIYEYQIRLVNNRKTEEEIVIWDQIPVSYNQEIKISLIKPVIKEGNKDIVLNDNKYLEWMLKLKPGQEEKLDLQFSVEYPSDRQLDGLE